MTDILARIRAWALEVEGPKPPKWNASNDVNQRTGRQLATALRERFPEAFEEPALAESKILKTGAPEQVALAELSKWSLGVIAPVWMRRCRYATEDVRERLRGKLLARREGRHWFATDAGRAEAARHEVTP